MARYAYRDKERKEALYASNTLEKDESTRFYCPKGLKFPGTLRNQSTKGMVILKKKYKKI